MSLPASLACTLEYAQEVGAKLFAAAAKVQDSGIPVIDEGVHDAIDDPDPRYRDLQVLFTAIGTPGTPGYVSIFNGFAILTIAGTQYQLNQQLAPFAARNATPDMAQADRNYAQQGHGADEVNVPVAGCNISFKLAPSQGGTPGVATPYYSAPGAPTSAS